MRKKTGDEIDEKGCAPAGVGCMVRGIISWCHSISNNDLREPCEESKLTAGGGKRGASESGPGSVSSGEPTSVTALVG